jgi:hypothetical protein
MTAENYIETKVQLWGPGMKRLICFKIAPAVDLEEKLAAEKFSRCNFVQGAILQNSVLAKSLSDLISQKFQFSLRIRVLKLCVSNVNLQTLI